MEAQTIELKTLDRQVLDELKEMTGDEALIINLLTMFSNNTPPKIQELAIEVKNMQFNKIAFIAHSLKSSSASIGAKKISNYFAILEDKSRNNISDGISNIYSEVVSEMQLLQTEINKMLPNS